VPPASELQTSSRGGDSNDQRMSAEHIAQAMAHLREAFALLGFAGFDCLSTEPARSPDRLLRLPEVQRLTGLKRSAIYEQMQKGTFPRSVKVGPRAASWSEALIQAWITRCLER
jgi:predicted DNA-binding transcriptional regulator AlpA